MDTAALNLLAGGLVVHAILAFSRIGTALLLIPGLGDARIPPRIRLTFAVIMTFALLPALPFRGPVDQPSILVALVAFEVTIGIFIATAARLFLATVYLIGAKIGYASGLSNSLAPNTGNFENATSISGLLYMGCIAFMFATNTHHIMLSGLLTSYRAIPVGTLPTLDMAQQIARISADAFYIAVGVGAPFLLFTVLFNAALGLANRVMPNMQVFFVAAPAMIILGIALLAMTIPEITSKINTELANWLRDFVR